MIVTEEEAKTKRCQESFGDSNIGSGHMEPRPFNVGNLSTAIAVGTSPTMCIGSLCMAWRWLHPRTKIDIFRHGETDEDFARRRDRILAARVGYCGKAGAPQERA